MAATARWSNGGTDDDKSQLRIATSNWWIEDVAEQNKCSASSSSTHDGGDAHGGGDSDPSGGSDPPPVATTNANGSCGPQASHR